MVKKNSVSKSTKLNSNDNEIHFIRLTNGEDIVAEVLGITEDRIIINNPLKIIYTPSSNSGYLSISLMQWVFTHISKQQKFDMYMTNVLVMTDIEDNLKSHYKESLNTFDKINDDKEEDDIDFHTLEGDEGIEMLKNLMNKIKGDKGRLH